MHANILATYIQRAHHHTRITPFQFRSGFYRRSLVVTRLDGYDDGSQLSKSIFLYVYEHTYRGDLSRAYIFMGCALANEHQHYTRPRTKRKYPKHEPELYWFVRNERKGIRSQFSPSFNLIIGSHFRIIYFPVVRLISIAVYIRDSCSSRHLYSSREPASPPARSQPPIRANPLPTQMEDGDFIAGYTLLRSALPSATRMTATNETLTSSMFIWSLLLLPMLLLLFEL